MFIVISATAIPDHLRGYLSRYLSEVVTGLFVGNVSTRVRDNLWIRCTSVVGDGGLVLISSDPTNEQGFSVQTSGRESRRVFDLDGLALISRTLPADERIESNPDYNRW